MWVLATRGTCGAAAALAWSALLATAEVAESTLGTGELDRFAQAIAEARNVGAEVQLVEASATQRQQLKANTEASLATAGLHRALKNPERSP